MKKIYLAIAALTAVALPSVAQDTYEGAKLMNNDLNGTARYVGMGGAMEALGADISVMGTNPAGIGLFRHSTISASLGVVSQQDAMKFDGLGKTNFSFDQAGFVYSARTGRQSFVNFGVNYHKSHNFDQILSAANSLTKSGASLNKVGFYKAEQGSADRGGYDLDFNQDGDLMGYENTSPGAYRAYTFSQLDYLYMNAFNYDPETNSIYFNDADNYWFDRAHRGWISDFDFNISGNINDRVYLGVTFGIHDVNYKAYSEYGEQIVYENRFMQDGRTLLCDERTIEGAGFDVKAGIIFRPVEFSPFRVGLSVSTPTFYDLKTSNHTRLWYGWTETIGKLVDYTSTGKTGETYEFKMYTPWKFGVSLGHTIGTTLALGASYEYADYSSTDIRINDTYDYYYDNWKSYSDREMNAHTDHTLKGVHTLKLGAELKPAPALSVRAGYNYVSAMYEEDGVRDATLNSIGVMYSSTADYVNWGDTQRLTCGLGYKCDSWSFDVAYQYSTMKGTFYPFQPGLDFQFDGGMIDNTPQPTKVSNDRHQVMMTIGYTF